MLTSFPRMRSRAFKEDQSGAATVEAVIWIPFFIMLFLLIVETAFVFYGHSRMQSLAQDASRRLSVGWFGNNIAAAQNSAESYVLNRMLIIGDSTSNQAQTLVEVQGGIVSTQIQVPAGELDVIGAFDFIQGMPITVYAQQYMEYN